MSPSTKRELDVSVPGDGGQTQTAPKRPMLRALLVLAAAGAGFGLGVFYSGHSSTTADGTRKILYYHDPMHPEYRSDKPGIAPDCGMPLEPVYADTPQGSAAAHAAFPTDVRADTDKVQSIGIVAEEVRKAPFVHRIRTVGRVAADETRIFRAVAGTEGWVREIFPKATGTLVKKGDLLAIYYARDFQAAQQSYIYALKNRENAQKAGAGGAAMLANAQGQVDSAIDNLLALGLSEAQLRELADKRETNRNIELRAPVSGFLLGNNVYSGMRFERGMELARVADLSSVWITADLYGNDAAQLKPGSRAEVLVPRRTGVMTAKVSDTLPQFDPRARTTKVRLELQNPDLVLRDGMFVDVEFPVDLPSAVHVPVDSVMASGTSKQVFVERTPGVYEPRSVQTGWEFGGRVQILSGVNEGERVVRSGAFMLDSETRMRRQSEKPAMAVSTELRDPVCGMSVAKHTHISSYEGHQFVFCSSSCKSKFDSTPATYARSR